MLTNVLLLLILGWLLIASVCGLSLFVRLQRFFRPRGKDQASPFGEVISATSAILAKHLANELRATLMGKASALGKAIDGAEGDVVEDMIAQKSPLIGALLAFSPKLRNRLMRSPLASVAVNALLGGLKAPGNGKSDIVPQSSMDLKL